ncbi:MAG TPA: low specificity L-threonine aldolase [Prolixibacteraceae bacterium]|nr:low specificity L-threonine aldolase [Prolixibacteraceae bacterium]
MKKGFASDNNSGVHPKVFERMEAANTGHVVGYGNDPFTKEAINIFRNKFGKDAEVFFVFNGTGANVLGLSTVAQSFNSIICAETAHIQEDECGAPEKFTGCKLLPVEPENGKITPEKIKPHLKGFNFEHHSQPRVISISQVTEMGTVYQPHEIKALAQLAHENKMFLHMDGARIANAAVALNLDFKEFTKDCGVDILSFGGTKNGMMMGEAVLFFNPELTAQTKYIRKQSMQLYSKMRFVGAQFIAYFEDDLWKTTATHSNKMAKLLAEEVGKIPQVTITEPVEANGVFAIIPPEIIKPLQERFFFYTWNEKRSEVRWMTSWDTTEEEIYEFVDLLKELIVSKSKQQVSNHKQ